MTEIIPAIIGRNFPEVQEKLNRLGDRTTWAQLDITDGLFTPEYSWQSAADLHQVSGKIKLETHLMIEEPENFIGDWSAVCDRVLVHPESTAHLDQILRQTEGGPTEIGLALLLETPLQKVAPFLTRVKNVQLMSIATIGHYGEPLDEGVYERIETLRAEYPDVKISVDGGVNLANAKKLITAGADRLVIGSALWQAADLAAAIKSFQALGA